MQPPQPYPCPSPLPGSGSCKGHRDGPADVALFHNLRGILVDWDGAIFVADSSNHCIRKITQDGHVITFAGGAGRWAT